jgi:hypothetical protein
MPRKGFIRDLAMNLPRGFKESAKANRIVRKAAEALTGSRIAVSGDEHGFSNLQQLCAKLEMLVGAEEPFVRLTPGSLRPPVAPAKAVS